MAADCNCSNPSCPCYKGNQDKAGEQQAPGPDSPSTQSTNGSTHGGNQVTSAEASSNGGGNIEVTNTPALRAFYADVRQGMVRLHESSSVAAKGLEQSVASYEQSLGWMTTEEFDTETISLATGIQEQIAALATLTNELAAGAGETVSNIDAAITHSLQTHAPLEELVAAGAAKSTASYMGG